MISATVLTTLLLAAAALAAPSSETVRDVNVTPARVSFQQGPNTFTNVTGIFAVPPHVSPTYLSGSAAIAVGIDGISCTGATFQVGVELVSTSVIGGQISYNAWAGWYPFTGTNYFAGDKAISINAGDNVLMYVALTSLSAGTAYIQNLSTGMSVSQDFVTTSPLCGQDAFWSVGPMPQTSLSGFANFDTVTFTEALATTPAGQIGPLGAQVAELTQSGLPVSTTKVDTSSITIQYNLYPHLFPF